ncbi:unnamed protein product [Chrysoparadoxa australica]
MPSSVTGKFLAQASIQHVEAECSGIGTCDRLSGNCVCPTGFAGAACERRTCPTADTSVVCSGHGRCLNIGHLAKTNSALPLSPTPTPTTSYSYTTPGAGGTNSWDANAGYACVCDSSWTVGLASGETQEAEWFGPDCSFRRCPSGDNPVTESVTETDCGGKAATGGRGTGATGNLCHVDCSNCGLCDYETGQCTCFEGFAGEACNKLLKDGYMA